jgi:hypothetical protein
MPLRTTLALVIAALWATSLLHAQTPDGDVRTILDQYRRFRPASPPVLPNFKNGPVTGR